MRRLGFVLALLLGATGCPRNDRNDASSTTSNAPPPAPSACAKVGETCVVSRGKLGTCVRRDDCDEPAGCFACQSQH